MTDDELTAIRGRSKDFDSSHALLDILALLYALDRANELREQAQKQAAHFFRQREELESKLLRCGVYALPEVVVPGPKK